jgi:hypothetical protein
MADDPLPPAPLPGTGLIRITIAGAESIRGGTPDARTTILGAELLRVLRPDVRPTIVGSEPVRPYVILPGDQATGGEIGGTFTPACPTVEFREPATPPGSGPLVSTHTSCEPVCRPTNVATAYDIVVSMPGHQTVIVANYPGTNTDVSISVRLVPLQGPTPACPAPA